MLWNSDVWSEMERLRREFNNLHAGLSGSDATLTYPLVNVYDAGETIVVTAELPGITREKVTITYADGVLTLAGKLEPVASEEKMIVVRRERATGDFEKNLRIPTKIDQNRISASFSSGILTVTLPKSEEAKPKTININVS